MMVAATAGPSQPLALGSAVPIRSVPLPAWTYLPQADRPAGLPSGTEGALSTLAQRVGELGAMMRHAPGAMGIAPRMAEWAITRAAAAEGIAWSGERTVDAADSALPSHAEACWRASLSDWAAVTGLAAAPRRAPAWIGPSVRLPSGGSTVPPPPHMLKDALAAWQRAIDTAPSLDEPALVRGMLDAAWSMWTMHYLQPVEHSAGLLARLVAARIFASRAALPAMAVVPVDALKAAESADLATGYETWVRMTVAGLAADAGRTVAGLERALAGRAALVDEASRMRAPRHPIMLANAFVARPRMSMQEAAHAMGISFRAAQAVMDKFLESGIVREDTGRRRDRVYVCPGVMFGERPMPQGERLPEPSVR